MAQATAGTATTIENPVINTPFAEPARHFVMQRGKPTGEIDERRRPSEFAVRAITHPSDSRPSIPTTKLESFARIQGRSTRQQQSAVPGKVRVNARRSLSRLVATARLVS